MKLVFTLPMIQKRKNVIWVIYHNMKNPIGWDIVI